MKIISLTLKGFRNLRPLKLEFGEKNSAIAFVGSNGQGKTNILEAIYMLALSKSFRSRLAADVIGFDEDFCKMEAGIKTAEGEKILEMSLMKGMAQKGLKINGVKKTASEFIGNLKAVFFSPEDISLISLEPKIRRRYMDILLSQTDRGYLESLMRYQETVKQRNALLRRIREKNANEPELEFWDGAMAEAGIEVVRKRQELVQSLSALIFPYYNAIAQSENKVEIHYLSKAGEAKGKKELLDLISKNHERDIGSGATQIGPHRDDLEFFLNGHEMARFASRGEWRSLVLALKFAEIAIIKEASGETPVLLLDDVFSELDESRQKYLMEAVESAQTFLTTTHKEFLAGIKVPVCAMCIEDGKVTG
ncbi:DNA replication/repair protein RecF [Candidatus Peregrinibacteria bacterium]|nr:DNA replication/repair protein RecF [Candidatus Peregrinibacteria bacterium]